MKIWDLGVAGGGLSSEMEADLVGLWKEERRSVRSVRGQRKGDCIYLSQDSRTTVAP